MAIRDENDNKVTPLIPQTNDDEVIKTAIWKFDVEEAMSKVDHGRYEYTPNGKIVYDTKTTPTSSGTYQTIAREIDFKKTLRYFPFVSDKTNSMIFIKSPVEQPYNYVGKDNCENACFAVIITKHTDCHYEFYDMALFGIRDGWLKAEITEDDNQNLLASWDGGEYWHMRYEATLNEDKSVQAKAKEYFSNHNLEDMETDISIHGPAVLLKYSRVKAENPTLLMKHIDNLISNEYRLFMSDDAHKVEAPAYIKTYMNTTGLTEEQTCQKLVQQLNAWPEGVRSHSELFEAAVNKVGIEKIESVGKRAAEYLVLLVTKEHWLDMKAANEKGLLYSPGPFSDMIQPGECADPDKMLEMIDAGIKNITDRIGNDKATIKPLRSQSERGEK